VSSPSAGSASSVSYLAHSFWSARASRQVYKAKSRETGEVVALKRVRMDNEKEGFPITAIREIKILKVLNHKNIVRLKEIVTSKATEYNQGKGSIYMVMEFCDHDLTGLTDAGQRFTTPQIKCYMKQLLEGMMYCHRNRVLHRDIKGSNLLINDEGMLKLADFGLARPFDDQQRNYTNRVITLWYRPPELLLGSSQYGPAIDMWSVGCIFAELLLRKPILPGRDEFEQLNLIFRLLGTPSEATWPGCSKLSYFDMLCGPNTKQYVSRFDEKFGQLDTLAQSLLRSLLSMDPDKRISAKDALDHDYFWTNPLPAKLKDLPKYPPSHEFTAKKRRQQVAAQAQQQQQPPQQQQQVGVQPQQAQHHHHQPASQQYAMHGPPHGQHAGYQTQPPAAGYQTQRGPPSAGYPLYPAKRYRDAGGGAGGGYDMYQRSANVAPPGVCPRGGGHPGGGLTAPQYYAPPPPLPQQQQQQQPPMGGQRGGPSRGMPPYPSNDAWRRPQ